MTPDVVPAMYYAVRSVILVVAIRDMIRKGIALRKAAEKKQIVRFICLFVLNTAGILPIIYILFFADKKSKNPETNNKATTKYEEKKDEEEIKKTAAKIEKLIKRTSKKDPVAKKAPTKKTK